MNLTDVSQTAIYTLICRVAQAERKNPIIEDKMSILCLEKLLSVVNADDKKRFLKWKKMMAGMGASDAKRVAERAITIDKIVNEHIAKHPSCTIISIGSGFDTRFWRINNQNCNFIELDLPETIALKKEMLKDYLSYEQIGCSVLDTQWIDQVTANGNENSLIVSEGLFMYLPESKAAPLLQEISERFKQSQIILDIAPEKFTKGFWKKMIAWQFKFFMGLEVNWVFGLKKPQDIESYGSGFKIIDIQGPKDWYIITASINA